MATGNEVYLAYLTEPGDVDEGSEGSHQHLTFVHPFPAKYRQVALETMPLIENSFREFPVMVAEKTLFGPNNDISVYLIQPAGILRAIHSALLTELENRGVVLKDKDYIGKNYTPHITIKSGQPLLEAGQRLLIDNIALIHKSRSSETILAKRVLSKV